jgi:hypothetical protein
MMSSRSWICVLCGALAASLVANVRLAWPVAAPRPVAPATECVLLQNLGLSDGQMERLRASCREECCSAGVELAAQAKRVRGELRTALAESQVDPSRVRALAGDLGAIQNRCLANAVESILMVRDILEPAQVAKMLEQCRLADQP